MCIRLKLSLTTPTESASFFLLHRKLFTVVCHTIDLCFLTGVVGLATSFNRPDCVRTWCNTGGILLFLLSFRNVLPDKLHAIQEPAPQATQLPLVGVHTSNIPPFYSIEHSIARPISLSLHRHRTLHSYRHLVSLEPPLTEAPAQSPEEEPNAQEPSIQVPSTAPAPPSSANREGAHVVANTIVTLQLEASQCCMHSDHR
jgi:hypothetical protein